MQLFFAWHVLPSMFENILRINIRNRTRFERKYTCNHSLFHIKYICKRRRSLSIFHVISFFTKRVFPMKELRNSSIHNFQTRYHFLSHTSDKNIWIRTHRLFFYENQIGEELSKFRLIFNNQVTYTYHQKRYVSNVTNEYIRRWKSMIDEPFFWMDMCFHYHVFYENDFIYFIQTILDMFEEKKSIHAYKATYNWHSHCLSLTLVILRERIIVLHEWKPE